MMIVGDQKDPTKKIPPEEVDPSKDAPPAEEADDPKPAPEIEPDSAEEPVEEDEYVPPPDDLEEDGLKTPPEYAQATDDEVPPAINGAAKTESTEKGTSTESVVIDTLFDKIKGGSDGLVDAAGMLVFELDRSEVTDATRKFTLQKLVNLYNDGESSTEQKEAVVHVFEQVRSDCSKGLFGLAMLASAKLNDDGEQLFEYVMAYADRVSVDGDDAFSEESRAAFVKAAGILAEKNPRKASEAIEKLIGSWFKMPEASSLWNGLMAIAESDASFKLEAKVVIGEADEIAEADEKIEEGKAEKATEEKKVEKTEVSLKESVKNQFMTTYKEYDEAEQAVYAGMIVGAMGEEVAETHVEIIKTLIVMGPKMVHQEVERALNDLHSKEMKGEIDVDYKAMREVYSALIEQAHEGCFAEDIEKCDTQIEKLSENRMAYAPIFDLSFGMTVSNISDFYGDPMKATTGGGKVSLDWMSSEFDSGARLLIGASYAGWQDRHAIGARIGIAIFGPPAYLKLVAGLEYLYIKAPEKALNDVPVKLSNPPINEDGTAYNMEPHQMDFMINAAALTINPELGLTFKRWYTSSGKTVALKGFIGVHAGIFLGKVYDDGCSYSYDPYGGDVTQVSPNGDGTAGVVQTTELGTRCRSGNFVAGTMFGAEAGLSLDFSL